MGDFLANGILTLHQSPAPIPQAVHIFGRKYRKNRCYTVLFLPSRYNSTASPGIFLTIGYRFKHCFESVKSNYRALNRLFMTCMVITGGEV